MKKNKTGGRQKGTQNKITSEMKETLKKILEPEIKNISLMLENLESEKRLNIIIKLLPYIMPREKETIELQQIENDNTIIITYSDMNDK